MKWDSTKRWLTLAGNIGVLAGIFFLAYELQQNAVATRLEGGDTSAVDQQRLMVFYNNVLRQWQYTHFLYLSAALHEDNWLANRAFMAQIISDDFRLSNHWRTNKLQYSSAFNNVLSR
jgi:hypothetical protein